MSHAPATAWPQYGRKRGRNAKLRSLIVNQNWLSSRLGILQSRCVVAAENRPIATFKLAAPQAAAPGCRANRRNEGRGCRSRSTRTAAVATDKPGAIMRHQ